VFFGEVSGHEGLFYCELMSTPTDTP